MLNIFIIFVCLFVNLVWFSLFFAASWREGKAKVRNENLREAQDVKHSRNASRGNSDGLMLPCVPAVFLNTVDNLIGVAAEQTSHLSPFAINHMVVFTSEVLCIFSLSRSCFDTCNERWKPGETDLLAYFVA